MSTSLQISTENNDCLVAQFEGRDVWKYQFDNYDYHPHFHPIKLTHFKNSVTMTNNLPGDHPWHQGMMFSWKFLNDHNSWEIPADKPNAFAVHQNIETKSQGEFDSTISHSLTWNTEKEALLSEKRTVEFSINPEDKSHQYDWTIHTTALTDVEFSRDMNHAGYGGFQFRGCAAIVDGYQHSGGDEFAPPDNDFARYGIAHGQSWVAMTILMDGIEREVPIPQRYCTVTVIDNSKNMTYPTPILVFKHMQAINPAVLNPGEFSLKKGETLELKYRVLVAPAFAIKNASPS